MILMDEMMIRAANAPVDGPDPLVCGQIRLNRPKAPLANTNASIVGYISQEGNHYFRLYQNRYPMTRLTVPPLPVTFPSDQYPALFQIWKFPVKDCAPNSRPIWNPGLLKV